MDEGDLSAGEIDILIEGLTDEVALDRALDHLGIEPLDTEPLRRRLNWKPSRDDLDRAFVSFRRLVDGGYVEIGDTRAIDGGPPGRGVPYEHVAEDIGDVRVRVDRAVAAAEKATDWAFQCWLTNTPEGDETARGALAADG